MQLLTSNYFRDLYGIYMTVKKKKESSLPVSPLLLEIFDFGNCSIHPEFSCKFVADIMKYL